MFWMFAFGSADIPLLKYGVRGVQIGSRFRGKGAS